MKQTIFLLGISVIVTVFTRCNKNEDTPQATPVSYWAVNGDTVAYWGIGVNTAPLLTELRVASLPPSENRLSIAFQMGSLPRNGAYKVDYVASDSASMCNVYVTYRDTTYDVDPAYNITRVNISALPNGKGRYELEPTWFYKQFSPSDSILVQAVIIEP